MAVESMRINWLDNDVRGNTAAAIGAVVDAVAASIGMQLVGLNDFRSTTPKHHGAGVLVSRSKGLS